MKRKTSDLKPNPNYKKDVERKIMPYVGDPRLMNRVKQYLQLKKDKAVVNVNSMSDDLQYKYSEYSRKKRNAFRKSVAKVYHIIRNANEDETDSYSKEEAAYLEKRRRLDSPDTSDSSSDSESESSFSSDADAKYVEYPESNSMNASLKTLYQSGASSRNSSRAPSNCPSPAQRRDDVDEEDDLFIVDRRGRRESSQKPKEPSKQLAQKLAKRLETTRQEGHCPKCNLPSPDGRLCGECQSKYSTLSMVTEIDITDELPKTSRSADAQNTSTSRVPDDVDVGPESQADPTCHAADTVEILSSGEEQEGMASMSVPLQTQTEEKSEETQSECHNMNSPAQYTPDVINVGLHVPLSNGYPAGALQTSGPGLVHIPPTSIPLAAMTCGLPPMQQIPAPGLTSPCLMPRYQPIGLSNPSSEDVNLQPPVLNTSPQKKKTELISIDDSKPHMSQQDTKENRRLSRHRKKKSETNKEDKESKSKNAGSKKPSVQMSTVKFSDIGGNDSTLTEVCRMLVHMRHPEIYRQLGVTPPRGFLLHGPPGCGKTLLAHAIAGELELPFIKLAATEIVSGVSGESEEKLRSLFDQAIASAPCILFIDEIDAITPKRETASKDMERRIVSQLLTCMDELNNRTTEHVLVIGATNRPDSLDPALRRAGRFDREISLGIPDENARKRILQVLCRDLRLTPDFDYDQLAHDTPGYVGADLTALVREAAMTAVNRVFTELQNIDTNTTSVSTDCPPPPVDSAAENVSGVASVDTRPPQPASPPRPPSETPPDTNNTTQPENPQKLMDTDCDHVSNKTAVSDTGLCCEANDSTCTAEPVIPHTDQHNSSTSLSSHQASLTVTSKQTAERRAFDTILLWLKEHQPLSDEQLADLFLTYEDFKNALREVQPSAKREGFATVPDVTWDDIGALHEVREELQMAILAPVRHRKQFEAVGLKSTPGVLLAGPPGCGKTLLAKAIANESGINFISVKGPELLNMYVGESERAVRQVFQRARNSSPCVIFFDELDALCPRRSGGSEGGASVRVVNQLLTEMDGLEERKQVFIMAATNRPDIIDPAVLRPGRLDKTLYVGLPNAEDRLDILKTITKDGTRPRLESDVSLSEVASHERCSSYTGADLAALVREAGVSALREYLMKSSNSSEPIAVSRQHFDLAFQKVKPSVSAKDQEIYLKMKKKHH